MNSYCNRSPVARWEPVKGVLAKSHYAVACSVAIIALLLLAVVACTTSQPITPTAAQNMLLTAWVNPQHVVWQIAWPQSPATEVVAEVWRSDPQIRFEILEATTPALVGETLLCDGRQCWQYNRLVHEIEVSTAPARLAPVTDAFGLINNLLRTPAQSATLAQVVLSSGPAQKVTLTFANGDVLAMWLAEDNGLPLQVDFASGQQQARLMSRFGEPLPDPAPELFRPAPWLSQ